MDAKRKAELMEKARKVFPRKQFLEYCNFLNNYELISARNHERITSKYKTV